MGSGSETPLTQHRCGCFPGGPLVQIARAARGVPHEADLGFALGAYREGVPCAAISVSGPSPRILSAMTADVGALVCDHAGQVSTALGYQPKDEGRTLALTP